MKFRLKKVLREFEFADLKGASEGNHVFDAVIFGPGGKPTRFTRHFMPIEKPWTDSVIVMNESEVIGSGETPRPFYWRGSPCISAATFSPHHGFINKIYIQDLGRWIPIFFFEAQKCGKNWMPFVWDDDLYFVHEYSPFRVLKAEYVHENDGFLVVRTVVEHDVHLPTSYDNYSWLRGGSNAVQIGDLIVGMGHTNELREETLESIWHGPSFLCTGPMSVWTISI